MGEKIERLAREWFDGAMNDQSVDLDDRLLNARRRLAILDYALYLSECEDGYVELYEINFDKKEAQTIADVLGKVLYRYYYDDEDIFVLVTKEGMHNYFLIGEGEHYEFKSITQAVRECEIEVLRPKRTRSVDYEREN